MPQVNGRIEETAGARVPAGALPEFDRRRKSQGIPLYKGWSEIIYDLFWCEVIANNSPPISIRLVVIYLEEFHHYE